MKNHRPSIVAGTGSVLLAIVTLIALVSFVSCGQECEESADTEITVVTDSVASADGVMIYYDVHGTKDRTIVLVHCWSCDRTYWDGQIDALTPYFRVVTVDLGGHGQSGLGRDVWTIPAFGADVAAVATKEGLSEIILVGHSMGGPVSIEAARALPSPVTAIIGVDNFQNMAAALTKEQIDGFVARFMPDFEGVTMQFVQTMFPAGTDTALVGRVARDMSSGPREVGISAIGHTMGYNYPEALADMQRPIRTISSDKFPTRVEANQQMAASFETRLIPGSGHFPHLENPDNFNRLLLETISEFWPEAEIAAKTTETAEATE